MATQKKTDTKYKRDKNKVEISGDPDNVKWQIWFDLIANKLLWLLIAVILICVLPKNELITVLLKWVKEQLHFLTLFVAVAVQLSG